MENKRCKGKRGYLYDALGLFAVMIVFLIAFYLWYSLSAKLGTLFGDSDVNDYIGRFNAGLQSFDVNLPYLMGLMVVATITAFAALNINRFTVFIFAGLLISLGLFMQFAEPALVQLVVKFSITSMPNLMYIIGQLKLMMFMTGIVMLFVGFVRGGR